uniref:Phospholipid-transporting ATPase (EC) n=1 Tax=Ganoderma boninense TaxID=34458 RepID=A0A5K1K8H9_9APHY|nr:Phospholipid-transporting ATPase (EC [Ganoderma boninense]
MSSNSSTSTLPDVNKLDETLLPPPLEGLRRDGEFWIEDGNLILVAKDVAFRVYRGLLAEQSTVLAEMAATASEDFDDEDHSPDELSSLVRLSHKYGIHDVEEQALDLLRERYADDFDEWCSSYPEFIARPISRPRTHCIGVVNIARLTNTPSLLPATLYTCTLLGATVMNGWEREDGCVEYLSTDDLKRCFDARERLCQERAMVLCKIFDNRLSQRCDTADTCGAELKHKVLLIMADGLPRLMGCAALDSGVAKDIHTNSGIFASICLICRMELQCRDKQARKEVWDKLPDIFGISVPGWGKIAD